VVSGLLWSIGEGKFALGQVLAQIPA